MVEYTIQLDDVFHALSDPIRRDIISRVSQCESSVGDLVAKYKISFAAVSKHLKVLEKARLVTRRKEGRKYMVALEADTLKGADEYLEQYRRMWEGRLNKLDLLLKEGA